MKKKKKREREENTHHNRGWTVFPCRSKKSFRIPDGNLQNLVLNYCNAGNELQFAVDRQKKICLLEKCSRIENHKTLKSCKFWQPCIKWPIRVKKMGAQRSLLPSYLGWLKFSRIKEPRLVIVFSEKFDDALNPSRF